MRLLTLIVVGLVLPTGAWAQGVNDPSTPNRNVIIVNPPAQSRPNATPNIPSRIEAPPPSGRARVYHGPMTRGSNSSIRR